MGEQYPSLTAFYADERRLRSPEADYGVWWLDGPAPGPHWRVSYVKNTGEVYAAEVRQPHRVEILGIIPPDEKEIYYATVDKVMAGWSSICGGSYGLPWIRERLAAVEASAWGADASYGGQAR